MKYESKQKISKRKIIWKLNMANKLNNLFK